MISCNPSLKCPFLFMPNFSHPIKHNVLIHPAFNVCQNLGFFPNFARYEYLEWLSVLNYSHINLIIILFLGLHDIVWITPSRMHHFCTIQFLLHFEAQITVLKCMLHLWFSHKHTSFHFTSLV